MKSEITAIILEGFEALESKLRRNMGRNYLNSFKGVCLHANESQINQISNLRNCWQYRKKDGKGKKSAKWKQIEGKVEV